MTFANKTILGLGLGLVQVLVQGVVQDLVQCRPTGQRLYADGKTNYTPDSFRLASTSFLKTIYMPARYEIRSGRIVSTSERVESLRK